MIFMLHSDHQIPVRPISEPPTAPGGAGEDAAASKDDAEEIVNPEHVLPGQEKHQRERHEPVPLRSPPTMTAAEKRKS